VAEKETMKEQSIKQNTTDKNGYHSDVLNSKISARDLIRLVQAGVISPEQYDCLLDSAGILPSKANWREFLHSFLTSLGTLFLLSGILFFFAYNWADLSKLQKLSTLQIGIVLVGIFIVWKGIETHVGKLAVVMLVILIGVLMATFGQIYQTGADPYELFTAWACIILPIAIVTRFSALWIIWLVVANLALMLFIEQGLGSRPSVNLYAKLGFVLNAGFLIIWEIFSAKGVKWIQERITPRIVVTVCLIFATSLMLYTIMEMKFAFNRYSHISIRDPSSHIINAFIYLFSIGISYYYYQFKKHDLAVAALTLFSIGSCLTVLIAVNLDFGFGMVLFIGVIIIVEALASVAWLRKKQLEWSIKS